MNNIDSLQALRIEKARLKLLCKEKEFVIGQKLDYIQKNLGYIALDTLFPTKQNEGFESSSIFQNAFNMIKTIAPIFLKNINLSAGWVKIIELAVGGIIAHFFNKRKS